MVATFVAVDRQKPDFVFPARIALLLGLDRFGDPVLAVLVAEMREQFDRRVGDAVELVVAAGLRGVDVAGIERIEKVQHPPPGKALDHVVLRRCWARLALRPIVQANRRMA